MAFGLKCDKKIKKIYGNLIKGRNGEERRKSNSMKNGIIIYLDSKKEKTLQK